MYKYFHFRGNIPSLLDQIPTRETSFFVQVFFGRIGVFSVIVVGPK